MPDKEQRLKEPLDAIQDLSGVKGAAVVRRDGLLIVSNLPADVDSDQLAAMTASTVGSGETASDTLGIGTVSQVTIESADGRLISTGAGENGILTVLTESDINMGLVLVEMSEATSTIKEVL